MYKGAVLRKKQLRETPNCFFEGIETDQDEKHLIGPCFRNPSRGHVTKITLLSLAEPKTSKSHCKTPLFYNWLLTLEICTAAPHMLSRTRSAFWANSAVTLNSCHAQRRLPTWLLLFARKVSLIGEKNSGDKTPAT